MRKEYIDRLAMKVMNPLVEILPLVAMNGYDTAMIGFETPAMNWL